MRSIFAAPILAVACLLPSPSSAQIEGLYGIEGLEGMPHTQYPIISTTDPTVVVSTACDSDTS